MQTNEILQTLTVLHLTTVIGYMRPKFEKNWDIHSETRPIENIFILRSNDILLRVAEYRSQLSLTGFSFGRDSQDLQNLNLSCTLLIDPKKTPKPESNWQVMSLGNHKIVARSSNLNKVVVIDAIACNMTSIECRNDALIPYHDSFDLIQFKDQCTTNCIWISNYDDEGNHVHLHDVRRDNEYRPLVFRDFGYDESNKKYLTLRYSTYNCKFLNLFFCDETKIEISDSQFNGIKTLTLPFLISTYSTAYGYFSVCSKSIDFFGVTEFACTLYDSMLKKEADFNWRFPETVKVRHLKMHNLKNGGAMIVSYVCGTTYPVCDVHYAIVNATGDFYENPILIKDDGPTESELSTKSFCLEPVILEKAPKLGIYCIILPCHSTTKIKCMGLQKFLYD